ncbi:MAG: rhodanese-like domain-containing protein [Pseudomonadota bacterium]|nr:rhodanese-like domain-containing protein [Pseudomonadota bacterium]
MKKLLLPALFAAVSFATFANSAHATPTAEAKALIQAEMKKAQHITAGELNKAMDAGKSMVLLDVRQKSERPIMGAITAKDVHIPRGFLEIQSYSKIKDKNAEIVVFCGKGIRSAFAANTLNEMGYKNVKNLKGGVKAWKEAGLPTIKP